MLQGMHISEHIRGFFAKHPEWDTSVNRQIVEEVNRRIDQFAHFPREATLLRHRKFLHHQEGIEYFGLVYGELGRLAATEHVLEDCGAVPHAKDYYDDTVDAFGVAT